VLVDSPRFTTPLVKRIEKMGGVSLMFLSHVMILGPRQVCRAFQLPRVMHEGDGATARGVEQVISGVDPVRIDDDLLLIPHLVTLAPSGSSLSRQGALHGRPPGMVAGA